MEEEDEKFHSFSSVDVRFVVNHILHGLHTSRYPHQLYAGSHLYLDTHGYADAFTDHYLYPGWTDQHGDLHYDRYFRHDTLRHLFQRGHL